MPQTLILGTTALLAVVVVHELGHLLAGIAVGFRFSFFAIGPLRIERTGSGTFRIGLNREPAFFGGAAATVPHRTDALRLRFAVVVGAGPVASLALTIVAATALYLAPGGTPALRILWSWLRLLSGLLFVATSLPTSFGGLASDGLRFFRLLRPGPMCDRELALLTLYAWQFSGTRPHSWDGALIARGLSVRDGSVFECQMHLFSYLHAIDTGNIEVAHESIKSALAVNSVPRSVRNECLFEGAFLAAAHLHDPNAARFLLGQVPPTGRGTVTSERLRAEGALALVESDVVTAERLLAEALSSCPGWATGPREWLTGMLAGIAKGEQNRRLTPGSTGLATLAG
jgi:peptidase M50-like protein